MRACRTVTNAGAENRLGDTDRLTEIDVEGWYVLVTQQSHVEPRKCSTSTRRDMEVSYVILTPLSFSSIYVHTEGYIQCLMLAIRNVLTG